VIEPDSGAVRGYWPTGTADDGACLAHRQWKPPGRRSDAGVAVLGWAVRGDEGAVRLGS
jgi:hypothetical protein